MNSRRTDIKSYEDIVSRANKNYIAEIEYKITVNYYKFSMPFIYKVMVGYAWCKNHYMHS